MTIPITNSGTERSVSAMNRVISKTRNRLGNIASDYILLSMNRDALYRLNLDELVQKWYSMPKTKSRYEC